MRRVLFITRVVQTYRGPFHDQVRARLEQADIRYEVAQGEPDPMFRVRNDTITLPWANIVRTRSIGIGPARLLWQPLVGAARKADLVIIGQENKYLLNYLLQLGRGSVFGKVALWGHGRNFQSREPDGAAERWKRLWATRADWWFAYTDESRRHVATLGFPPERITVFNNAVDTGGLQRLAAAVSEAEIAALRAGLGVSGDNVAIFVGGLYSDKRLDFLVSAADRVRARISDFTLIVVGGGEEKAKMDAAAVSRPWLIVAGPRFDSEKAALMRMAKLFLMPGLLGLAVLDAGAMGLPVVTTRYPWHSPEIAYLRDGETGAIVDRWTDVDAYADAVATLLTDEATRSAMALAARRHAATFTIEAMAERFADGIAAALAAPIRRG